MDVAGRPAHTRLFVYGRIAVRSVKMNKRRWKGMFVSEKQYNKRIKQCEARERTNNKRKKSREAEKKNVVEGRRIVEIEVMAEHLYCTSCKEIISLEDIVKENRKGLVSIFSVKCRKCLKVNLVPTGKQHMGPSEGQVCFDTNTKAALGTIHSGLGHGSLNKFLHVMNIPAMSANTFKKHEREIGPVVELVAKETCKDACAAERSLTLANLDSLRKLLPDGIQEDFLTPGPPQSSSVSQTSPSYAQPLFPMGPEYPSTSSPVSVPTDDNNNDVVRVFASYDMGWSKRGTGRQYDSLNGYGSLIGKESGRVLDFATRNRKCRICDASQLTKDHDCRKNFWGTAKAMEPDVAVELATQSKILKASNLELGVFIGDNDSSSICAVRKASDHVILKQSDKNHTSKGVTNLLYKIDRSKDPSREMTSDAIKYLHRCFTYAMAQHQGNTKEMAAAIKNIPYHAFNKHDSCGEWCRYLKEGDNYKHSTISGGFKNQVLFEELKVIFGGLANNADKYSAGASSQANESLNGVMSKKAPKAQCYSLSESADYRFSCAVGQKNRGEKYVQDTCEKYSLSPGSHLSKHIEQVQKSARRRAMKAKTPNFKLQRRLLQKKRSQLKNQKESIEGETYKSHMGLLDTTPIALGSDASTGLPVTLSNLNPEPGSMAIVIFDIETSGLKITCDVLQIAMRCNDSLFNKYIDPSQSIPHKVSEIHGITNEQGDLYHRGIKVLSSPLRVVLGELLQYLQSFGKPCILTAHNCAFDGPRLMRIIQEVSLVDEFRNVIAGFADTLVLFRKKFPHKRSKGDCTLTTLAVETLNLSPEGAHDASYDVFLLEKLVEHHFTYNDLTANMKRFDTVLHAPGQAEKTERLMQSLDPLDTVVSKEMRKKMASAGISYDLIVVSYKKGEQVVRDLLEQRVDGKPQVIKTKKILNCILEHLKQSECSMT